MNRLIAFISMLLIVLPLNAQVLPIGVGDHIHVVVHNEPDLTVKEKVGTHGTINMPLVGVVTVVGKTPDEISKAIMAALDDGYLVEPQVRVAIDRYRPFYIRGKVESAGAYEYVIGLTVSQAIAIAGGLTPRASNSGWYLTRGPNKTRHDVTAESKVLPGDVIEIPESFF
ncbi:polysaccharide export protein [Alteromonas sediminis]|uniref:Polysaccharide export protein n=1 Tax=Alteromonas sediminis TaxID=2259342 RepID=A0A3N5Y4P1_9ALTE|nr:polysaccharide biosynthesis/export family protein [Alteromonas sediminis]RPJ67856.1 polysaccharide export protein [Alteromonas sediminis]